MIKLERAFAIIIFIFVILFCCILYNSLPGKYKKSEENFGGFMKKRLVKIEFEKSPLHTIVYCATGTGKNYFVKQYLKLYIDQEQDRDNKNIIIVCKDERNRVDPETGAPDAGSEMCDINMITMKNILKLQNSVIVLDDMGYKFNKDIVNYFTEGRNKSIQMNVMCFFNQLR